MCIKIPPQISGKIAAVGQAQQAYILKIRGATKHEIEQDDKVLTTAYWFKNQAEKNTIIGGYR